MKDQKEFMFEMFVKVLVIWLFLVLLLFLICFN